jgi:hypothetical protein
MVKKSPVPGTGDVFNAAARENARAREGLNAPRG